MNNYRELKLKREKQLIKFFRIMKCQNLLSQHLQHHTTSSFTPHSPLTILKFTVYGFLRQRGLLKARGKDLQSFVSNVNLFMHTIFSPFTRHIHTLAR